MKTLRVDIILGDNATAEQASRMATSALSAIGHAYRGHDGLLVGRRTQWDDGVNLENLEIAPSPVVDRDLPALA